VIQTKRWQSNALAASKIRDRSLFCDLYTGPVGLLLTGCISGAICSGSIQCPQELHVAIREQI
jgi:hypothetical protein